MTNSNGTSPFDTADPLMVGGAGWWWLQASNLQMQAGGGEFVAKNLKPSPCARFQATSVEILLKWVAVSIQQPVTQGGVGFGVSWYGGRGGYTHLVPYPFLPL